MKLGMFMMPLHPPGKNYVQSLKEDREAIILADRLGYTEALVGEHVTDLAETVTDCAVFLASLMSETHRIKLGTGTLNLPNRHPAQLAATVSMLDSMLEGRFICGISPGGLPSDMEVFGNLNGDRNAMFVECIDQMIAIWTGEAPYRLQGRFWNVSTERTLLPEIGQGIIPRPLQRPHPPILVTAVAPHSAGVTEAAARGWDPISANFLLPQWVKTHWPKYQQGCTRAGRDADPANWRVAKTIFVSDDASVARRYGHEAGGPYHFYYKQLGYKLVRAGRANLFKSTPDQPDSAITPEYLTEKLVIAGTVDEVVDRILALRDEVGDFGTLYYACTDWVDPVLGRRSMELMAEQVMPRVNAALGH